MRILRMVGLVSAVTLAACGTVRQEDLRAWEGVPVEALDTHSLFITIPMVRTKTDSGIEIRNYVNSQGGASCFSSGQGRVNGRYVSSSAFTQCSDDTVVCNNIFYIKDGKVIEYAPRGMCRTNDSVRPQERYYRLKQT